MKVPRLKANAVLKPAGRDREPNRGPIGTGQAGQAPRGAGSPGRTPLRRGIPGAADGPRVPGGRAARLRPEGPFIGRAADRPEGRA